MFNYREQADMVFYGDTWVKFSKTYKDILLKTIKKVDEHTDFLNNIQSSDITEYVDSYSDSPLIGYLKELNLDDIKSIKTVMYIGRDKDHNQYATPKAIFNKMYEELELNSSNSKEIEIGMITEKTPLRRYILDGMHVLKML